ncbi:MAG: hypothetical protein WBG50_08130 [Desulfomonilaceae bacterium]
MTDNKPEEIISADFEIGGSPEEAARECEEDCTAEPEDRSEEIDSEESDDVEESASCEEPVERWNPWPVTPVRYANLTEARHINRKGRLLRERRSTEAYSGQYPTIDPTQVKFHDSFKELLSIDQDLVESMRYDMDVEGYKLSLPIVLATWPGQEEPVLIDGHTRVEAGKRSGIEKIPYSIERFDDIEGALEYVATVQAKRRHTDQWVLYQLIIAVDSPMDRGGDRRSDEAKSKGPNGPIEMQWRNSAQRTAFIVKTNETTVKRARRIHREGTPEIIQGLRERKMTISQAEKAIINAKTKKTDAESEVIQNKDNLVSLTDDNLAALKKLGGNRHDLVNTAVAEFVARKLGKKSTETESKPEEKLQEPVMDLGEETDKES